MVNIRSKQRKIVGGWTTKSVIIPIAITLAIIHAIVISVIILINVNSSRLSTIMQNYGQYIEDATSLQGGSSLLSETSSIFVLTPLDDNGEVNYRSLIAYANEIKRDRRGKDVLGRFMTYDVNSDVIEKIKIAAESAEQMLVIQRRAIGLVRSVYELPKIPVLDNLPTYELTESELSMTNEERLAYAAKMMYGPEYSSYKQLVSENTTESVGKLRAELSQKSSVASYNITITRIVMWVITILVILILLLTFVFMFRQLVVPLTKFTEKISSGDSLDADHGLYEVRLLASSYNGLLERKGDLENALRSAAETDALTGLPNRFSFNQLLSKKDERGYSVAAFLFDVNFLKITNDTKGHVAGDKLICDAGDCIKECFGNKEGSYCFRFGGDEFAALIKGCSRDEIDGYLEKFEALQKEKGISIATGYAYADEISESGLEKMFLEADKKMYENKATTHKNRI